MHRSMAAQAMLTMHTAAVLAMLTVWACIVILMPRFTHTKRHTATNVQAQLASMSERVKGMQLKLQRVFSPTQPEGCFNMQLGQEEVHRLVAYLYDEGNYRHIIDDLIDHNPDVAEYLEATTSNQSYHPSSIEVYEEKYKFRISFATGLIMRGRNPHMVPALNAALTCDAYAHKMPHHSWDILCLARVLCSRAWLHSTILPVAKHLFPTPTDQIEGVSATCFDNFTICVGYKGMQTIEQDGYRLDMTNWLTVFLPLSCLDGQQPDWSPILRDVTLDGRQTLDIFRPGFDKLSLVELFDPEHVDIESNKFNRFSKFMVQVAQGSLFSRPTSLPKHGKTLKKYQKPMMGMLQSSQADVEEEIKVMRESEDHKQSYAIFMGEDGLSVMRHATLLERDWREYLYTAPAAIPMQGEKPHSLFHFLHTGWRNYKLLIVQLCCFARHSSCLTMPGWAYKEPTVELFNVFKHGLCLLMRGTSEWLIEATDGAVCTMHPAALREMVQGNVDSTALFDFLNDFCFHFWDATQDIRGGASKMDLLWREALGPMRCGQANKTQYSWMCPYKLFWSNALAEPLATIHREMRTLSLSGGLGSGTGWDDFTEKLNLTVRKGLHPPGSDEYVEGFVQSLNFTGNVSDNLRHALPQRRSRHLDWHKKVDADVELIKNNLRAHVGANTQELSAHRGMGDSIFFHHNSTLPHDLMMATAWGVGDRGESSDEFVERQLNTKISWM